MNGGQHLLIGTATTGLGLWLAHAVLDVHIEQSTTLTALAVAGFGSLAPDIDHPRAVISHGIPKELRNYGCSLLLIVVVFAAIPVVSSVLSGRDIFEIAKSLYDNPIIRNPIIQVMLVFGAGIVLIALTLFFASAAVSGLFGHRGAAHSLFIAACATSLAIIVSMFTGIAWWYGLIFGWGYLTHLLADATTEMGLPELFWPVSKGW